MHDLQIAIRKWARELLGVPSHLEVEVAALKAYGDHQEAIARAMADLRYREQALKATEDRISAQFRELERREVELEGVASQTTLAIYDLVEQTMLVQKTLKEREENQNDKP